MQLTLDLNTKEGRKPKPLIDMSERKVSFSFKQDSEVPALIEKVCRKDPDMPLIKFIRIYRKLKESRERETPIDAGQMCGE